MASVAIGEAARLSGVSQRMVRHYETLGLLAPVTRTDAGYRQYGDADVDTLRFIKRARALGFSIADIGQLVSLWQDGSRSSASVKRIAQEHVDELARRIEAMRRMQAGLQRLLACCHGDARPDCPILDGLAEPAPPPWPMP